MTGAPRLALRWVPSERDRLAEVDHVDGRRRPWRAGLVGALALAVGAVIVRALPGGGFVAVAVLAAGVAVATVAAWRFPIVRSRRAGGRAGPVEVTLGGEGAPAMTVFRGGLEQRLAPGAVERLVVDVDHVFLHLAEAQIVTIPCRALGAERGGLDRFVRTVDGFRRSRADLDDAPEPGRAAWSLRYDLRRVGVSGAGRHGGDLERLLLSALAVGIGVAGLGPWLLSASPRAAAQGLELLVVGGAALAGLTAAVLWERRRGPEGPVALAVGPDGGWMRSRAGSIRFGWDKVLGVEAAQRLVVLRFADRVLPVPEGAFAHEPEQQRFVGDVRGWWRAARRKPLSGRAVAEGPSADPFAPPASER
ncbi:MAG: hypothetical protein R3F59_08965 [Myxococcota bacterium]